MISTNDITVQFGGQELFKHVNITFTPGNQYYQLRNAATGQYMTYTSGNFKTISRTNPTGNENFHVMRGEPDDFLVFARRSGAAWQVGGFTVDATTLTVRFEDVWNLTPPDLRVTSYSVEVLRDGVSAVSQNILPGIAPDARLFIDLAANGGFLFTFTPEETAQ